MLSVYDRHAKVQRLDTRRVIGSHTMTLSKVVFFQTYCQSKSIWTELERIIMPPGSSVPTCLSHCPFGSGCKCLYTSQRHATQSVDFFNLPRVALSNIGLYVHIQLAAARPLPASSKAFTVCPKCPSFPSSAYTTAQQHSSMPLHPGKRRFVQHCVVCRQGLSVRQKGSKVF